MYMKDKPEFLPIATACHCVVSPKEDTQLLLSYFGWREFDVPEGWITYMLGVSLCESNPNRIM